MDPVCKQRLVTYVVHICRQSQADYITAVSATRLAPVGAASLYPHYASLKTVMGLEEQLKHPVRAVAAAVSQARIGYGKWRICTGAREPLTRIPTLPPL